MSLQTDIETAAAQIEAARDQIVSDAGVLQGIVQGPASGPTSLVTTQYGDVRTAARAISELGISLTGAGTFRLWKKTASGGETSVSGAADGAGASLAYTVGTEQVYLNGVKLIRGTDYSASSGNSITGLAALTAGDIVEVIDFTDTTVIPDSIAGVKAATQLNGEEGIAFDFLSRSYAIRDYNNVLSRMGHPSQALTVTRASTAAYVDRDRVLKYAANNALRYDYDPMTGVPLGLLIEGARTNVIQRSETFDNAYWVRTNLLAFGSGSTADAAVAPDGATTADLITEDTATGSHQIGSSNIGTINKNDLQSFSVWVKPNGRTQIRLQINAFSGNNIAADFTLTGNGTVDAANNNGTGSGAAGKIIAYANGWYRLSLSGTPSTTAAASVACNIILGNGSSFTSYTGDGASGAYVWGAQDELGGFPSSYIPTVAASATRSADNVTLAITAFPFVTAYGTIFVETSVARVNAVTADCVTIGDGTSNETLSAQLSSGNATVFAVVDGGVSQASLSGGDNPAAGATRKSAASWRTNDFAMSLAGAAVTTDTTGTLPTVTNVYFGSRSGTGSELYGYLRKVIILSRDMTDTELRALAA